MVREHVLSGVRDVLPSRPLMFAGGDNGGIIDTVNGGAKDGDLSNAKLLAVGDRLLRFNRLPIQPWVSMPL